MSRGVARAERLEEMARLYLQRAYSDIEMAERLSTPDHRIDRTTVFRDRTELERNLPFDQDSEGRHTINRARYLPNIRVNLCEALSLYLAARRASQQTHSAQKHTASALEKLAVTLKQPMTARLVRAADVILRQKAEPERDKVFETVADAWVQGLRLRVRYQGLQAKQPYDDLLSPYLIEPSPWSDSVYVIGPSDWLGKIVPYKLDRIQRASLSSERFTLPKDFDEQELLRHAWGIWRGDGEPVTVKLKFAPGEAARRVQESVWHPLERVTPTEDGGCLWEAPIAQWREMLPWVRGWGADCTVLEPQGLRQVLQREVRKLAEMYGVGVTKLEYDLIAHWRKRDKEAQSLQTHLLETSQLAERFAAKVELPEVGRMLGLVHDLGKASLDYQNYLRTNEGLISPDEDGYSQARRGEIDHSTAGAQLIYRKLASRGQEGKFLAQFSALALASHHSGLIDCLAPDGKNNFQRRMDKPDEDAHFTEVIQRLPDIAQQLDGIIPQPVEQRFHRKLYEDLRETGDSKETLAFKRGLLARFLLSCLLDADRLNTADFETPENELMRNYGSYQPWPVLIERLERKFAEFDRATAHMDKLSRAYEVNQLRTQVAQSCLDFGLKPKGVYRLTVPTGGGKTLASLRFALHHAQAHTMDRVFYVVPYITIIDQNADTVREILEMPEERDQVVLEHHSNFVPAEDTRRRHSLLAENWDAPVIFTTQVQFLEALFGGGTRDARRMHQLADAVIILDEVQTIPIKAIHLFTTALRFLVHDCGATVLLCTATQPPFESTGNPYRALNIQLEQHIIQDEQGLFERLKRVEVHDERKPGGWTNEEIADLAGRGLEEKGSVLMVMNTRGSARALYQEVKKRNLADIYHLSTNMCPAHRLDVLEKKVKVRLEANEPVICVSTQLIEAGVDIDFGAVIRALAGLDSIAQSAGRCNRHGLREGLGSVWVVNPQEENLDRLPDIRTGRDKVQAVLDDFRDDAERFDGDRIGLQAIAEYYRYYFRVKEKEMNYPVGQNSSIGHDDDLFSLLSTNTLSVNAYTNAHHAAPDILLRQSFQAAGKEFQVIDSVTRGVVVPYKEGKTVITDLCGAVELEKQYGLLKKAQRYSVNLFSHEFERLSRIGAIQEVQPGAGIYHLDEQYYSEEFGWSLEPVSDMEPAIA